MLMEKKPFNRVKKKKTIEEKLGRATEEDVACTEKSNNSQFTSYINRKSDTSYVK